ncbi:hypothetical protein L593_00210 [Salinarchaeum sp. Harcht-Bsk1]|uniref:hypothetical protein n=1 Tax=Salinarchaeum sp. Harcht-Bsk1 TaxID=1333523 RepID=UPI000342357C|nr:hypothetical protein [Salinarchaeum sp. Harcht-Bsk1]AGM99996.1 hypothetical protein L593_00210 [Salinarchaeum sp. Harcht-Bsk1]
MSASSDALDGETVEATLLEAEIIEPTTDGDDHRVAAAVMDALDQEYYRMANPNAEREQLRTLLGDAITLDAGSDEPHFEAEEIDDGFELRREGTTSGRWPSRLAFRTDLAFSSVLEDRIDDWDDLASAQRGDLLSGTRLFLDTCPDCEASLSFRVTEPGSEASQASTSDDSASHEVALLACGDCEETLFVGDAVVGA